MVSLETLGVDLTLSARFCVVETLGDLGSLQLSCGVVPQALCKGSGRHLEGHRLVERELTFVVCSPENRVRPSWRWLVFVTPHPSNVDVLPLKRKELRESHLHLRVFYYSVTSILYTCI